jgi:hypothetical protein
MCNATLFGPSPRRILFRAQKRNLFLTIFTFSSVPPEEKKIEKERRNCR